MNKSTENLTRYAVVLPKELMARIREEAGRNRRSTSAQIRWVIEQWLDSLGKTE
jgi:predicted DNA-binding protein